VGDVAFRVHAEGYRDKELTLPLSAKGPAEAEVTLEQ